MENTNNKCSSKKHTEINAINYCQECKIYLCNKCLYYHSELFENHILISLDKNAKDIFISICQEKNHNNKLDYFCKSHNKLCCSACLCKIKDKGDGQHKDCDTCTIENIINEKKKKLNENIKTLEKLSTMLEQSINELKEIFNKINENKEKLKLTIQKIFTKLRNAFNDREDELLLEIDKEYNNIYCNEEIIKESEKLPYKIQKSLDKGKKIIDREWNNNNLSSLIYDCINIEDNIIEIDRINDNIKKCHSNKKIELSFKPEEEGINIFLKNIKSFGKLEKNNIESKENNEILENIINEKDSLILKNKINYQICLKNWINPNKNLNFKLLFRMSKDGDSLKTFHNLCDNKGPTISLYLLSDGNIVGGYTPLDWDTYNGWKYDNETFVFNINKNLKCSKKVNNSNSIFCHDAYSGFYGTLGYYEDSKNSFKKLFFFNSEDIFKNGDKILDFNNRTELKPTEVEILSVNSI